MAVKSVSIRIEEEMLRKIGYVADYEGRSVNSHILVLIRENIKQFEDDALKCIQAIAIVGDLGQGHAIHMHWPGEIARPANDAAEGIGLAVVQKLQHGSTTPSRRQS